MKPNAPLILAALPLAALHAGNNAWALDREDSKRETNRLRASYTFENPAELIFFKAKDAKILSLDSSDPISGSTSLRIDAMAARDGDFNDVQLCAKVAPLKPDTIYHIRFSYRVLQCEGGTAQFQVASPTLPDWLASRGVENLRTRPGKTEIFDRIVVTDEASNYQIKLSIRGRLRLLLDDITFEEPVVNEESLRSPALLWPRNHAECVQGTVELGITWDKTPAREYAIELSRTDDFSDPRKLAIWAADHTARDYCNKGVNLSNALTGFLPEDFGEGLWYWRGKANLPGAAWSPPSQFTIRKASAPVSRVRKIGNENPAIVFPFNRNAKKMSLQESIAAQVSLIPETIRPNFILFSHAGWAGEIHEWWPEFMAETRKLGVAIIGESKEFIPVSAIEEWFRSNPQLIGWEVPEFFRYMEEKPREFHNRLEWLARLLKAAQAHGRYVLLADNNNYNQSLQLLHSQPATVRVFRQYADNLVLLWKGNATTSFSVESQFLGSWLAGCATGWGSHNEPWYWASSGYGDIGENLFTKKKSNAGMALFPEPIAAIMWLIAASAGGSCFDSEFGVFFNQGDDVLPVARDYMLPLFQALVDFKAIPTRQQVLNSMQACYQPRPEECRAFPGNDHRRAKYQIFSNWANIYETAYGMTYFNEFIPKIPGVTLIPHLPSGLAAEKEFSDKLIMADTAADMQTLTKHFASYLNNPDIQGKNMYCVRVGDAIFACNGSENGDQEGYAIVKLAEPFREMSLRFPPCSYLVAVQREGILRIHCNGWRKRENIQIGNNSLFNPTRRVERTSQIRLLGAGLLRCVSYTNQAATMDEDGLGMRFTIDHSKTYFEAKIISKTPQSGK